MDRGRGGGGGCVWVGRGGGRGCVWVGSGGGRGCVGREGREGNVEVQIVGCGKGGELHVSGESSVWER